MTDHEPAEVPLHGGTAYRGLVMRVGETVRKPQRPTSDATHALLRHLHNVGFGGAPQYLGVDGHGRDVLTYVHGDAVTLPYPTWALTDAALVSVAQLLRRYHEAVATFDPTPYSWPKSPPPPFDGELVSHNDPNLDNVVFRDGHAVALIDFDLASPGSAAWDVAAGARLWAPLRMDADVSDARRGQSLRRFQVFVAAYGMHQFEPKEIVEAVALNHDWLYSIIQSGAESGSPGFADYWQQAAERAHRTHHWFAANRQLLTNALTGHGATTSG